MCSRCNNKRLHRDGAVKRSQCVYVHGQRDIFAHDTTIASLLRNENNNNNTTQHGVENVEGGDQSIVTISERGHYPIQERLRVRFERDCSDI